MDSWDKLREECENCSKCDLSKTRNKMVFGRGSIDAKILFIGEGPGEQEDRTGEPFVGPAGKLLDLLLIGLEFDKKDYYIANIVKCRPPGNRIPTDKEKENCLPHLRKQASLIIPKIIVCLGSTAAKSIIDKDIKITRIRGEWKMNKGFYIMPTYHPSAILRDSNKKILYFKDFNKIKKKLLEIEKG